MAELSRVSRDGKLIIVKVDGKFYQHAQLLSGDSMVVSIDTTKGFDSLSSATSSGSWRRPTAVEKGKAKFMSTENKKTRTFRVPGHVHDAAKNALEAFSDGTAVPSMDELMHLSSLASGQPVPISTIKWFKKSFSSIDSETERLGGNVTKTWISKFKDEPLTAAAFMPSDDFEYYAIGEDEENPANAIGLLIVDDQDNLFTWTDGNLFPIPDSLDDYEAPSIVEISDEDATALAGWLDTNPEPGETFTLTDIDPEERNLVELAYSEIDWDEIDRMESLTADATGYSPAERSENASRQYRSNDGRFGGDQVEKSAEFATPRARLTTPLPLVEDVAARIDAYLAENSDPAPVDVAEEAPVVAAGESSDKEPLYFAVVDPVDQTAVLDVVSITPDESGQAAAWRRAGGEWVSDSALLSDLRGDTPPPVVELQDEGTVKDVLSQVDEYDSSRDQDDVEQTIAASAYELADYSKEQRENDAKKGLALPDGSYPIRTVSDLENAIKAFGRAPESKRDDVKKHIKKRAKALNRNDLVPSDWKSASIFDDSHLSPLYGEYGEIIAMVAAGGRGGNAETLRRYWTVGKGAAKIRWGTEGDLTRCHRQLSKYMPGRSWGYCQNLHQRVFGMSNAKRDKLVGQ